MPRLSHLALTALLLMMWTTQALAAGAAEERRGVDAHLGGGMSTDPNDDDTTGNIMLGIGYRGHRYWALGLEGLRIKLTSSGMRVIVGPYAKVYPFYNRHVNPYGRAGLGLINIKADNSEYEPDTRFNLVPSLAGGLEVGGTPLGLYGEISEQFGVRYGGTSTYDNITSITVGLSFHFFENNPQSK